MGKCKIGIVSGMFSYITVLCEITHIFLSNRSLTKFIRTIVIKCTVRGYAFHQYSVHANVDSYLDLCVRLQTMRVVTEE